MSRARAADKQHRWLSLVEVTGVVLSEPVLADTAPAGFRSLEKKELAQFYKAREVWNLPKGMVEGDPDTRWVDFVLEELLRLKPKYWQIGAAIPDRLVVSLSQQREVLRPTRVLMDEEKPSLLFLRVPRSQALDAPWVTGGSWKASPTTKLERLLREIGVEVGLLTNGEAWRVLIASPSETASWLTWTVQTWADSPSTLAAFVELLGEARFFAGPASGTILELVKASRKRQADVAGQLGKQVREALETFVSELDRVDLEAGGSLLRGYSDDDIVESANVFLMRLLFILKAEETGLLPHGTVAYDRAYGVLHLLTRLENANRLAPEKLKSSFEAYSQLLGTFRVVYGGSPDPDIHVAPFLGGLFDPDRYPLLEGRRHDGSWPTPDQPQALSVRDSVVREILRSLKYARGAQNVVQWVSFAQLEVEHIGHMYEGLLDRKLERAPANDAIFLLAASAKLESAPLLASELRKLDGEKLVKRIVELTGKTKATVSKLLEDDLETEAWPGFEELHPQVRDLAIPIRKLLQRNGIVRPGGIYVTSGETRRSQGAHYTPPTLTEPIVRRTLGPIVYHDYSFSSDSQPSVEQLRSPRELLEIKVCDPAMGSGAFLVQVVRYLGERLADAWDLATARHAGGALTLPFGEPSLGAAGEQLLPAAREERILGARRLVVERCIYGVDRNHLAVEMAKLSLWLETLSIGRPFSYLDHALRTGDALVGLTRRQIECFHWSADSREAKQTLLFAKDVAEHVSAALRERRALLAAGDDYTSPKLKSEKLQAADERLQLVRDIGDAAIAAFFSADGDNAREEKRIELAECLAKTLRGNVSERASAEITALGSGQFRITPFHWNIEFPEVFDQERHGFDAIVGNPPFAGSVRLARMSGARYTDWLRTEYVSSGGKTDLVAFFFRRAFNLLRTGGCFGLIATQTICQGDTRLSSLLQIRRRGGIIFNARRRLPWPGEAAVTVSVVHVLKPASGTGPSEVLLDDRKVANITAYLFPFGPDENPVSLSRPFGAFLGNKPFSKGFIFADSVDQYPTLSDMRTLLQKEPSATQVIKPYLIADDLLKTVPPGPSRWAIDLSALSLDEAKFAYPQTVTFLEKSVRPGASWPNWWQFARRAQDLRNALAHSRIGRYLVIPEVSEHFVVLFQGADTVPSGRVVVFPVDSMQAFALLQARTHEVWVRVFSSSLEDRLSYVAADCFENFPFPHDWQTNVPLETAGKAYYEFRAALMIRTREGLTKTYNRFHDPDEHDAEIAKLRELHAVMDRAILDAYGWSDIPSECEFLLDYEINEEEWGDRKRPYRYRWPDEVRDDVLVRLLELNGKRAEAEQRAAARPSKAPKHPTRGRKSRSSKAGAPNGPLFET